MSLVNRLSITITDAEKQAAGKATTDLVDATGNFNVVIDKETLKSLPKIADGRIPFVEKTLQFCAANPEFLPPFADVPEFQKDFQTYQDIREMLFPLRQVIDNLEKTMMVSGSEAWYAALNYYRSVQFNAKMGVPGAQTIYDELRPLFEAKNKPDTSKPDAEDKPKS